MEEIGNTHKILARNPERRNYIRELGIDERKKEKKRGRAFWCDLESTGSG
jgi:hypothetical protein